VWVDCDVIQADGGTRTASITGSYVALVLALRTLVERGVLPRVPVEDHVAGVSVGIVDGAPLLDLAYEEDSKADVDMNIIKTSGGRYIEIQGTAEAAPFDRDRLYDMLALADVGIAELVAIQKKVLG
jgi:ribonuclease PH